MLLFKCANCQNLIETAYANIGEIVECPVCQFVQIVPDPPLNSGNIFGDYRILRTLKSDIIWISYLAEHKDKKNGNIFLLKRPTSFFLKRVSDFEKFSNCIIKYGTTQIRELPTLVDRNLTKGREYFVYNYIEHSKTLADFVVGIPLKCKDSLLITKKIAQALQLLYEKDQGVHLNLKPDTVLFFINNYDIKLLDCGIASFIIKETQLLNQGLNIWNEKYLSPEFISHGPSTDEHLCDIYSLGCILYFLITGREPNQSDNYVINNSHSETSPDNIGLRSTFSLAKTLMEKDPAKRISLYPEIISKIDGILSAINPENHALEFRKKFNIWKRYETNPQRSSDLIGFNVGKNKKKVYIPKKTDVITLQTPAGKVFHANAITAFNATWRNRSNPYSAQNFVYLTIAIIAIAGASIYLMWTKNKDKSLTNVPVPLKENINPPTLSTKEIHSTKAQEQKTPQNEKVSTASAVAMAELKKNIENIEAYFSENTDNFDQVIQMYEDLKRPYVLKNDMEFIGELNNKIFDVEKKKERAVESTVQKIIDSIKPYLEKKDIRGAISALDSYTGKFANETKRQRAELSRKILEGASFIELQKSSTIRTLSEIFEKNVIVGQTLNPKTIMEEINLLLRKPEAEIIKDIILNFKSEIERYINITEQKNINKNYLKKIVEDIPENDSPLLKGLLLCELNDFQAGYQNFEKVPYSIGIYFISFFSEVEAQKKCEGIFKKYSIDFTPEKQEEMMLLLSKKLKANNAKDLLQDIKNYEFEFAETDFLLKIKTLLESVKKNCFNLLEDKQKYKEKEIVISEENGSPLGQELYNVLEKADNFTTIFLKKGVYRFGTGSRNRNNNPGERLEQDAISIKEFRLSLTGLKLIGEEGVVFEDSLTITAQSIEISNIRIDRGKFSILPNTMSVLPDSGGITVRNCVFNDEETLVIRGSQILFENCFMRGMIVQKGNDVNLKHCTIISQERGLSQNAALWIDGGNLNISDSIISGKYFAVVFSDKESNVKKIGEIKTDKTIFISGSVIHGEQGLALFQFKDKIMEEAEIAKTPTRFARFCRSKNNIFYQPLFVNPQEGDWRLVKGTPGYKGGVPQYKGGPINYKHGKNKADCGVIWEKIQAPK